MFMTGLRTRHRAGRPCTMFMTGPNLGTSSGACMRVARAGRSGRFRTGYIRGVQYLQQGMRLKVFSKVYCDRVYFLCAKRFVTCRVRFWTPSGTPLPIWEASAPPPPGTYSHLLGVIMPSLFSPHCGSSPVPHIVDPHPHSNVSSHFLRKVGIFGRFFSGRFPQENRNDRSDVFKPISRDIG